jgi:Protein of unknown function (DUF3089)
LATTAVLADGTRRVFTPSVSPQPIDCFYVYPSVSTERRPNSDLVIHTAEAYTAVTQAAQFAPDCAVFAPMYHQVTSHAGTNGIAPGNFDLQYSDVLTAWRDYLAHSNHGHVVKRIRHPGDGRETVSELHGAQWGLHAADVNLALTELVRLVGHQVKSYR